MCVRLLRPRGVLLISNPNFEYLPYLLRRLFRTRHYRYLREFSQSGIHLLSAIDVERYLGRAGLTFSRLRWNDELTNAVVSGAVSPPKGLNGFFRRRWQSLRRAGLNDDRPDPQASSKKSYALTRPRWNIGRLVARSWVLLAGRGE